MSYRIWLHISEDRIVELYNELNIDYYQLTPYLTAQEKALEAALWDVLYE